MEVLDLFSGIGGFSLGLERAGMKTVAFCEIEPFCQKVLKKHWANIPIYNDVTKLTKEVLDNDGIKTIDVICGGYPCQPFSVAGKQKGSEDKRHLWPEMFRIIREVRPGWVIAENVEGHIKLGLDTVLDDLESEGYTCWTFVIPACAVGAPHQRNRIWIIANAASNGHNRNYRGLGKTFFKTTKQKNGNEFKCKVETVNYISSNEQRANTSNYFTNDGDERIQRQQQKTLFRFSAFSWCKDIRSITDLRSRQDIPEPLICRGDDGFPQRVDRIKALGNAVVPQIPELIGKAIMQYEATWKS